jgi:hypothetical protein
LFVFPSSPVNMKRNASLAWFQPSNRPPQVTQEFIDNHTRTLIDHMDRLHTASERKLSELKYMVNLRERLAADKKLTTVTALSTADTSVEIITQMVETFSSRTALVLPPPQESLIESTLPSASASAASVASAVGDDASASASAGSAIPARPISIFTRSNGVTVTEYAPSERVHSKGYWQ